MPNEPVEKPNFDLPVPPISIFSEIGVAGDGWMIQIDRQQLQPPVNRFELYHPDHLLVSRDGRSIPRLAEDLEVFLQPQPATSVAVLAVALFAIEG